jgi:hypothetical protein
MEIRRILVLTASSHRAACFVDDALRGFVLAELVEDGLLPCQYGRVEELYARGDAELERALAEAAIAWLWQHDISVIRSEVALDEPGGEPLESLGFEPEATRFGLYRDGA